MSAFNLGTRVTALVGLGVLLALIAFIGHRRLAGRRLLRYLGALSTLPVAHAALVWAEFVPDEYLRLERVAAAPLVTLAGLVSVALLGRGSLSSSPYRRPAIELSGWLAAVLCALAVAGPEVGAPLDRLAVIVAIDRSRSIDLVRGAEERIAAELAAAETSMRPDDRIGIVAFAADAAVEDPLRAGTRAAQGARARLGRDGTNLEVALRRALAELPSNAAGRIVVVSDGVVTDGDANRAAAAAVAAGVPIDVVPLDQTPLTNLRVERVSGPGWSRRGEPVALRIVTDATQATRARLDLLRNDEVIQSGEVDVPKGQDVLRLKDEPAEPGLYRYDVRLSALEASHDRLLGDNLASTFVRVRGPASVLILEGDAGQAQALTNALEAADFVVATTGATGVPGDLATLARYDAVVLSDIPAYQLTPEQLDALASYTRDVGGGLLLMGGDRSLGPGGYGKTPVEEVSPVSFDLKQDRRRAGLAEIIAIDYSGSMGAEVGGHTKLELANDAAARSAELLGRGDKLGVMHVDTTVAWSVPLAPVDDTQAIMDRIRAVGPGGGGIFVDTALEAAFTTLRRERSHLKHVLLFADGGDAEQRERSPGMVKRARGDGISTSVVALGHGPHVPDLERLSVLGGGRFYLIEDATRLPAIFAQETIMASGSAIVEEAFKVTLTDRLSATRGVAFDDAPALGGYVVTLPKPRTQVVLTGPERDPVLASWSVGIGRAAAFTSDYKNRWGAQWTAWPGAARLFVQLMRELARAADDPTARVQASVTGSELQIRASVVRDDGSVDTFRQLSVSVAGPGGFHEALDLTPVGAGAYAATLPLTRPGAYMVSAVDRRDGTLMGSTGAVFSRAEELRPTGASRATLARLARLGRGRERDTLAGLFNDRGTRRFAYQSLEMWLLALAGAMLLLNVAARRVSLPETAVAGATRLLGRSAARSRDAGQQPTAVSTPRTLSEPASSTRVATVRDQTGSAKDRDKTAPGAPLSVAESLASRRRSRDASTHTSERGETPRRIPNHPTRPAERRPVHPTGATTGPRAQEASTPPKSSRGLSAAEILLAKRRDRRGSS